MKYPLEQLNDLKFEGLVSLICTKILGKGTSVFVLKNSSWSTNDFNTILNKSIIPSIN